MSVSLLFFKSNMVFAYTLISLSAFPTWLVINICALITIGNCSVNYSKKTKLWHVQKNVWLQKKLITLSNHTQRILHLDTPLYYINSGVVLLLNLYVYNTLNMLIIWYLIKKWVFLNLFWRISVQINFKWICF